MLPRQEHERRGEKTKKKQLGCSCRTVYRRREQENKFVGAQRRFRASNRAPLWDCTSLACLLVLFLFLGPVAVSGTTLGQQHAVAPGCAALRWTENVSGRCCGTGSRSIMGRFRGRPESLSATWFLVIIGRRWFQQERFCAGGAARVDLPSPARIFFWGCLAQPQLAWMEPDAGFSPRQHDKYSWSTYINKFSTCHTFVKDGCCFCRRWAQIIVPFASPVICQGTAAWISHKCEATHFDSLPCQVRFHRALIKTSQTLNKCFSWQHTTCPDDIRCGRQKFYPFVFVVVVIFNSVLGVNLNRQWF